MRRKALLAPALFSLFLAAAQAAPTANKDLNGDGKADVLWRNTTTGDNYVYPMDGRQILPSEGYLRAVTDQSWAVAGTGDFDGNGTADLLWRHGASGENYVYFMNGTQIASEGYLRTVADTAWKVVGIGDFDQDGNDDILWRNAATGENYVYLMDGLAVAGEGYVRTVSSPAWKVAGVGDADGDGNADILWRNSTTGENYLYPMSGTTILGTEGYLRTVADANWRIAGIGDVSGDGKADIVWRNSLTGENYLYPLNGTAILGGEGYLRTVADLNWQVVMVGDFDGDLKADILWRNAATGENYIYFMDGTSILPSEGFIRTVAELGWQVLPSAGSRTDAPWGASARISNLRNTQSYEMFTPSVALTSQHVGFVAWNEYTGACGRIWVNRNAGGVWDTVTGTDIGTTQAISPFIAANSNGDAIAVWVEREWTQAFCGGGITGNEVWASFYAVATGTWSAPSRISVDAPADSTIYAFSPVATLDDAGRGSVVWIQDGLSPARNLWHSRFEGTWSAPALLSASPRNTYEPTLKLDGSGNVIAVWVQDTSPYDPGQSGGGPSLPNIWAARFDATAAAWSAPARIGTAELSGFDGTERPRLAVNAAGDAVAVWRESRGGESSIVATRFSSGAWSTTLAVDTGTQYADWPWVAIDAGGNAQAVWIQRIDGTEANESGYTARLNAATGTWSAPELFEQSTNLVSSPKVGMDSSGRATIAWNQTVSGVSPVHAVHYTPATGFGPQTHFPGNGLALEVNAVGTALLASEVTSFEGSFFGISIRAAMSRP